jgi:integrase
LKRVHGIYDLKKQSALLNVLRARKIELGEIYTIGISTGLRISDILSICPSNLFAGARFEVAEQKTGKVRYITLPIYPFSGKAFTLSRQSVNYHIREVAKKLGLMRIGTHSMRKTYAYNVYILYRSVKEVQMRLNHRDLSTTALYLIDGLDYFADKEYTNFNGMIIPSC